MIFPRPTKLLENGCMVCGILTRSGKEQGLWEMSNRRIIDFEGEGWKSSRLSYHLNVERLPKTPKTLREGIVCHTCDNEWCINPEHLYLGTAKQNTKDIFERNKVIRAKMSAALKGNTHLKGKKWSEEARKKQSEWLKGNSFAKGKKWSDESRARASSSGNRKWSEERKKNWAERMKGNTRRKDYFDRAENGAKNV